MTPFQSFCFRRSRSGHHLIEELEERRGRDGASGDWQKSMVLITSRWHRQGPAPGGPLRSRRPAGDMNPIFAGSDVR